MEIVFLPEAEEHLAYWKKVGNKSIQNRITALLEVIVQTPYTGIGKPEKLKYNLAGLWSRRINREHRLVYEVSEDKKRQYFINCVS